jgi:hypothetical protein
MQTSRLQTRTTAAKPMAFASFRRAAVKAWHFQAKAARDP